MIRLLLLFVACQGCRSCGAPSPGGDDSVGQDTDTEDSADSADSADSGDTAPPPLCAQVEVEPNDQRPQATPIELNWWSCGTFYDPTETDWDYVSFDISRSDAEARTWLEVDVEAQTRASVADPELILYGPDDQVIFVEDFARATDPYVVFPTTTSGSWEAGVYEKYGSSGLDYTWFLRAIVAKQPIDWSLEEVEPNDALDEGFHVVDGDRVFGVVEDTYDLDWYTFTAPEGVAALTLHIEANNFGSPLDARLAIYDSLGTKLEAATSGLGDSYDKDPLVSEEVTAGEVYSISVRIELDDESQIGGPGYWYVLNVAHDTEDITDSGP